MAKPFPLVPVVLCGGAVLLFFLVHPLMQAARVKRDAALGRAMAQAVADRDEDKALALLADGAVANVKDAGGTPALMDAINLEQAKIVDTLLAHGADVNAHRDIDGQSVLISAVDEVVEQREDPALVRRLLNQGADINSQDANRQTALIWAINNDYPDKQQSDRQAQLIGLLLAARPNLELRDAEGDTALRHAEKAGNNRIAVMLRQAGAKEYSAFPPPVHRVAAYAVTDLGPGQADVINSRGDVIGVDSNGQSDVDGQLLGRSFFWRTGKLAHLGSLGGLSSTAMGLNDRGQVVGEAETAVRDGRAGSYIRHAFLWQNGRMQDLYPHPGAAHQDANSSSSAMAINDAGKIVGLVGGALFVRHGSHVWEHNYAFTIAPGVHWDGVTPVAANNNAQIIMNLQMSGEEQSGILQASGLHMLPPPPAETLEDGTGKFFPNYHAYGINRAGDVVGDTDSGKAALWHRGQFSYLGGLYDMQTKANGLNNRGLIVGVVSDQMEVKRPELHACLWRNGKAKDLNGLIPGRSGWTLEDARAVNDRGQIVGRGTYQDKEHAYLLTPVTQFQND